LPFLIVPLYGQFNISLSSGYGVYDLSEMKKFQEYDRTHFPVNAKIISSFPEYWFYEGSGKYLFRNNFMLGISMAYGSTGGRTSYADYSGKITSDELINFKMLTISLGGIENLSSNGLAIAVDLKPGITFTGLTVRYDQEINNTKSSESYKFRSQNITVQPTLSIIKRWSQFAISAGIGYHLTVLSGKISLKDQKKAFLSTGNEPVHAEWSGLRVSGGLTYFFKKKDPES